MFVMKQHHIAKAQRSQAGSSATYLDQHQTFVHPLNRVDLTELEKIVNCVIVAELRRTPGDL